MTRYRLPLIGRPVVALLAIVLGSLIPSKTEAVLLAYEGFDYTSGTALSGLGTAGGGFASSWSETNGPANSSIQSGDLTYSSLLTSGTNSARSLFEGTSGSGNGLVSDNKRDLTLIPDTAGTVVWVSFLLRKDFTGTAGSTFSTLSLSSTNAAFPALLIGDLSTSTNLYGLGQQAGSGAQTFNSSKIPTAQVTEFLVAKITFLLTSTDPDKVELFVNPTPGITAPTAADATKTDLALNGGISRVEFNESIGTATKQISFDEIRIGTTYGDVAPAVPEPGSAALILAGSLCLAGCRRRA